MYSLRDWQSWSDDDMMQDISRNGEDEELSE